MSCAACVTAGCFWESSLTGCVHQVDDEYGTWTTADCSFEEGFTTTTSNEIESSSLPMEFTSEFEQSVSSTVSSSFLTEGFDALTTTVSSLSVTGGYNRTSSTSESTTGSPGPFCSTLTPRKLFLWKLRPQLIDSCESLHHIRRLHFRPGGDDGSNFPLHFNPHHHV